MYSTQAQQNFFNPVHNNLAFEESSPKTRSFTIPNFHSISLFCDFLLSYMDIMDPIKLLQWFQKIWRWVNKVLLTSGNMQLNTKSSTSYNIKKWNNQIQSYIGLSESVNDLFKQQTLI